MKLCFECANKILTPEERTQKNEIRNKMEPEDQRAYDKEHAVDYCEGGCGLKTHVSNFMRVHEK